MTPPKFQKLDLEGLDLPEAPSFNKPNTAFSYAHAIEDGEIDEDEVGSDVSDVEGGMNRGKSNAVPRSKIIPLQVGQKILKHLPKALQYAEDAWLYPDEYMPAHGVYRRFAGPLSSEVKMENGFHAQTIANVIISIRDDDDTIAGSFGYFGQTQESLTHTRCVKMHVLCNSQVPSIRLQVDRGKDLKKVDVYIFADCLRRAAPVGNNTLGSVAFRMNLSTEDFVEDDLPHHLSATHGEKNCLWETRIITQYPADPPAPFGPAYRRFLFVNISQEELTKMDELARDKKFGDPTIMRHGEWVLYGLRHYNNFSLYRPWNLTNEGQAVFAKFKAYYEAIMDDCARNGNFPHYVRQAAKVNTTISDPKFNIASTVPPRDIVQHWRVTFKHGVPVAAEPERWPSFPPLHCYPSTGIKAFALRLGLERSRGYNLFALQECFDEQVGRIVASFTEFTGRRGFYWVELSADPAEGSLFGDRGMALRPPPGTRITINIVEGEFEGVTLKGQVQDDLLGRGADISATCWVPGKTNFEGDRHSVSLEVKDDPTAINRQNFAICYLSEETDRQRGADLASFLLGAPRSIPDPGALGAEVMNSVIARTIIDNTLGEWGLDAQQHEDAMESLKSPSGITMYWGPPGTGKTRELIAIAMAHVALSINKLSECTRRPVLAIAPSNAAADNMLRVLISSGAIKKHNLRVCRFKGTHVRRRPDGRGKNNTFIQGIAESRKFGGYSDGSDQEFKTAADEILADFLDALAGKCNEDKDMVPYHYNNQRAQFVKDVAARRGNDQVSLWCQWFEQTRAEIVAEKKDIEKKKALRKQIDDSAWIIDAAYLRTCHIVICTNSSAAHETLIEYFNPVVWVFDESALATYMDLITPAAAFKETIECVVIAGDRTQQGTTLISKGVNEAYLEQKSSLFELFEHSTTDREKVMLRVQRRMAPWISGMVSRIFYNGELQDHPDVAKMNGMRRTIVQGLEKLHPLWNGRLRVAVDVSGAEAFSELREGSRSWQNKAEAVAVVDHLVWLLNLPPAKRAHDDSTGGKRILPENIKIITPYKGQVQCIQAEIRDRAITIAGIKVSIIVLTSMAAQGTESDIVLHSWVRNQPDDDMQLGFTTDAKQLCVNFSRAKDYQASFGNWRAWMQKNLDGEGLFAQKKRGKRKEFAKIVEDFYVKGDLVSSRALKAVYSGKKLSPNDDIKDSLKAWPRFQGQRFS